MRLSLKFSLVLTAIGWAVIGWHGFWLVQRERAELRQAAQRELSLLGRSLQVALENALRDRQVADIQETVERLDRLEPTLDIWVLGPDGGFLAGSVATALAPEAWAALQADLASAADSALLYHPPAEPVRLVYRAHLSADDGRALGTLLVTAPLDALRADLERTARGVALSVGAFALLTALAGWLVGVLLVGRPLARLLAGMREVQGGDLDARLPARGQDELAQLARAFNATVEELQRAQGALRAEADARQALQVGLQRADKLIALGQLAAGLAHEIGSPLQVLAGRGQMLAEQLAGDPPAARLATIMVEQVDRISRIVERMLTLGRREGLRPEPVALAPIAERLLELLRSSAARRGVRLRLAVEGPLPEALADPDQVQQVLLNLVNNAVTAAAPEGEVVVALAVAEGPPRPGGPGARCLRLTVCDDGPGVPPEVAAQVFEPFFTTRARAGGLGLGLAVVQGIARAHGGDIRLVPRPDGGRGACLQVTFPLAREQRDDPR